MNQLSYGQKIKIPGGIVRSVSFDKIRQGSLSTSIQGKVVKQGNVLGICQKIMNKKLLGQQGLILKKPLENISIQNNQESKKSLLKRELDERQMSECTFKPKINRGSNLNRTIQQFIENQMRYERKKEDKVSQMREMILRRIDKQNTFQPSLIANNRRDDKRKDNVHNRLYEESTRRLGVKENSVEFKNNQRRNQSTTQRKITTFSRKGSTQRSGQQSCVISKKHNQPSCDPSEFNFSIPNVEQSCKQTDSQDGPSSRRESSKTCSQKNSKGLKVTKFMDVQQICDRKLSRKNVDQKELKKGLKNRQILIKKILREINYIIVDLSIKQQNLSYIEMSNILQRMNFYDEQMRINNRKYLYEIWEMLQGEIEQNCSLLNLVKIIFSLLGFYEYDMIQESFGEFFGGGGKGKKLMLSQKEGKMIKMGFQELSLNRLKKGEYNQNMLKHKQYSFKPFVSKNSSQMAQKYRKRVIEKGNDLLNKNMLQSPFMENKILDHVDFLLLDDKLKELKIKNKREEIERQKKRVQDESMNGEKNKKRKSLGVELYEQMGNERREYLYELGKNTIRVKNQKNQVESVLDKECTFHPKISKSKQNSFRGSKQNSMTVYQSDQIKDYDKSIYRMYQGRRFREQGQEKRNQVETNTNVNTNNMNMNKQKGDESPLLYLNINMQQNGDVKIPVFRCDDLKTITKKVRIIMQIDQIDDQRLCQILKVQILPVLQEIGLC